MNNTQKSNEFIEKADELLAWSEAELREMREHGKNGNIVSIKRNFFSLLGFIASANDAIGAAARKANFKQWDNELSEIRKNDPLLNYFWAARNVDMHDTLIKWTPLLSEFSMQVVDAKKAERAGSAYPRVMPSEMRIWCYLYNLPTIEHVTKKFSEGRLPTQDRMHSAGVQFVELLHTLRLVAFSSSSGGAKQYEIPTQHLGKDIKPLVHETVFAVLEFYRSKLIDLKKMISINDISEKIRPI